MHAAAVEARERPHAACVAVSLDVTGIRLLCFYLSCCQAFVVYLLLCCFDFRGPYALLRTLESLLIGQPGRQLAACLATTSKHV